MPRYFFDVDDGERRTADRDGHDMASPAAARRAAIGLLPAVAADVMPDGDQRLIRVDVHEGDGQPLFHASLWLRARWAR